MRSASLLNVFAYDPLGRLVASRSGSAAEVRFRFDPAGNRLPGPLPDTVRQTMPDWRERVQANLNNADFNFIDHDPSQRSSSHAPVERWLQNRIGHHAGIAYRYDAWGNRSEALQADGSRKTFGYDGLHRLVEVRSAHGTTRYRYDAFGRRLAKEVSRSGNTQTLWFGWDGDRLTRQEDSQSQREMVYEPGAFVPMVVLERKKGSPSATEALLTTVDADEATHAALAAMPAEARALLEATLQKAAATGLPAEARAVLAGDFDTSGADQALAQTRARLQRETLPTSIRYYHCDHLGTPIALTDEAGKVVWQAKFDPWGNVIEEQAEAGIEQPIRFQGQFFDEESGLHYNRHRYYDPAIGGYLTQDPIGLIGGVNRYGYVGGGPLSAVDPLGLETLYVYNGPTFPSGNNPFGHTAMATTGSGIYSFGNNTQLGSSVTGYLQRQAALRDTAVVVVPTTPEQEQQMLDYLKQFSDPNANIDYSETCAARTAKAFSSAGILRDKFVVTPQSYGFPYSQFKAVQELPGAQTIVIPKGGQVPAHLSRFNPC